MALDTSVRIYKSTDVGAPACNGNAGGLIAVLDACLINGYGSGTVTSITRSGTTATATRAAHGYSEHDVIEHAGADQAGYNITAKIFNVTANTYDFEVSGSPATPATGTITGKKAGGRWTQPFTTTANVAVYKPDVSSPSDMYLRIDDSVNPSIARGYETMSDLNTGTGMFNSGDVAGTSRIYWDKSSTTDATARPWVLFTDGVMVYLFTNESATTAQGLAYSNGARMYAFGDLAAFSAADVYAVYLCGQTGNTAAGSNQNPIFGWPINGGGSYPQAEITARSITGVAGQGYVNVVCFGATLSGNNSWTPGAAVTTHWTIPYPATYGSDSIYFQQGIVCESYALPPRGFLPGGYFPLANNLTSTVPSLTILSNISQLSGRKLMAVPRQYGTTQGRFFVDITGPWR